MAARIVEVVVAAHDDVESALLDRRGDDDLPHALLEVGLEELRRAEFARALEHQVNAQLAPGDVAGLRVRAEAEAAVADQDRIVAGGADVAVPPSVDGVEFEQVGGRRRAALDLIDVCQLELRPAPCGAHGEATHAAKAVDADGDAHTRSCWRLRRAGRERETSWTDAQSSGRPWQQSPERKPRSSRMPSTRSA
jgi:hypothetical protein